MPSRVDIQAVAQGKGKGARRRRWLFGIVAGIVVLIPGGIGGFYVFSRLQFAFEYRSDLRALRTNDQTMVGEYTGSDSGYYGPRVGAAYLQMHFWREVGFGSDMLARMADPREHLAVRTSIMSAMSNNSSQNSMREKAMPLLIAILLTESEPPQLRVLAASGLSNFGTLTQAYLVAHPLTPAQIEYLQRIVAQATPEELKDYNSVARSCKGLLSRVPPTADMLARMTDPRENLAVRTSIMASLHNNPPARRVRETAIPLLVTILFTESEPPQLRALAARALGDFGTLTQGYFVAHPLTAAQMEHLQRIVAQATPEELNDYNSLAYMCKLLFRLVPPAPGK